MSKIVLQHYDYDTKQTISDGEVDTHAIAKAINPEQMAEIIRDWLNSTNSAALRGELVGKKIAESHRTLQGLFYTFLLAAVVQLVCDYPDDRNQRASEGAAIIKRMLADGSLPKQPYI
jgi:hypothetical protein